MKRIALPLLALLLGFGLLLPSVAHAVLMRVDFTVLADASDPTYAGQTASGYFTYDSSIAPAGGGYLMDSVNGLNVSDLSLTWDGHTWTTADADAFYLEFDPSGNLTLWEIGGVPLGLSSVSSVTFPDFLATDGAGGETFWYSTSYNGGSLYVNGSVQSWSVAPAPTAAEPGTLALLLPGLLPLGFMLRRRNKS